MNYAIEHNGECWQSVFPESESTRSQLHATVADALEYMRDECGIAETEILFFEPDLVAGLTPRVFRRMTSGHLEFTYREDWKAHRERARFFGYASKDLPRAIWE